MKVSWAKKLDFERNEGWQSTEKKRSYVGIRTRRKSALLVWRNTGRGMLQDKLKVRRGEPLLQGTVLRLQNLNLLHKLWEICYWFGGNE